MHAAEKLMLCANNLHLHKKSEAAQSGFRCGEPLVHSRHPVPCNAVYCSSPDKVLAIVIHKARDEGALTTSQVNAVKAEMCKASAKNNGKEVKCECIYDCGSEQVQKMSVLIARCGSYRHS